ncbi:MAG: OmpA family protein [Pseudomonadota bacterium]
MTQTYLRARAALAPYFTKSLELLPLASTALGLTMAGSIASANPLQSGDFSFTINSSAPPSGSCTGPGDAGCVHSLTSVTIGSTTYTDFTFPSAFSANGFPSGSNVQSRIQGVAGDFVFSSPSYATDMLANVFSDMDLNKYQQIDSNAASGFSTFTYPNDVPATSDFYFITTERHGNNDQIVQAFDAGGNALGSVTVNRRPALDYTDTGVNVGLNQNGYISVIPMDSFNVSSDPLNPSQVRSLRISYTGFDGADHKTFIIGAQTIGDVVALDDDYAGTPVNGVTGGAVGSVLANDDLNGGDAPTDGSATTITVTDADGLTGVSIADNGTITVPAGTSAGTYDIVYELCDEADPTTCDTATATVVVTVPVIDAVNDDFSGAPIAGASGGSVGSVLANDTLGGSAVATDGSDTTISITDPDGLTGVTIADNGTISVPAATPAGTYHIVYEICDEANATMCDTATATLVVSAAALAAGNVDFSASPVVGATGGSVGSVLINDTLNGSGVATDGSETTLTVTDNDGLTGVSIADNGTITVPASTPIGTYAVEYQLCEELNPTNCATATATVVVVPPAIEAHDDSYAGTPVDGGIGGTVGSVLDNDELAGSAVATDGSDTTITVTDPDGLTGVSIADDGTITVPAGTTAGTYDIEYELCDEAAPTTCDTATATVSVSAPTIDAVDDDFSASAVVGATGGVAGSVLGNDTLGGAAAATDGSATTIAVTDPDGLTGVTIADNGNLTVPAGTPAGTYDIVYELCAESDATLCDSATATVVVSAAPIAAGNDDFSGTPIVGMTGGSAGSVLGNDTLGGSAVATDGSETVLTITDEDGLTGVTIADDGTISVPAATPIGTYTITYQLCEELNPTNCATATATVVATAPAIDATDDSFAGTPVDGFAGGAVGSVLANDQMAGSGVATDGSQTTLSVTDPDGLTGVSIADDGTITVPAGTPAGTYDVVYQLCDQSAPTTCDTATATIAVSAPAIDAADDTFATNPVGSGMGGTVGSVMANDTLSGGGVATDGSQTTLSITDPDGLTGVAIADNGTVTIPAGTSVGTYNVVYQLCDALNPTNCDTAIVTIAVDNTDLLDAIADDLTTILEDDLAATLADQSARMGDYASGALDRLKSRTGHQCAAAATLMAKNVLFDTDKAIIKPESDRVLDEIAGVLATCNGSVFEIGGHTDSRASDAYNIALSQRRVNAVLGALTERGIDTSGFVARGYGERRPVASNATVEGMAQNRRVEFALMEDGEADYDTCGNGAGTDRGFDATAGEAGLTVNGSLFDERYDCAHDRWSIVEGTVSYLDTDSGLERTAVNLSFRRERFVSDDSVRGYFVGLYGSQSDVDREATGEIEGAGLNAGLYGATRLHDNLYLDYYLGAATGVHDFDLAFDDPMGVINATGDYTYVAGFAGAALSGDLDYGSYTLSPRAGVELAYAPGGDAEVEAALGAVTQSGTLALDSVSGSAVFAEFGVERGFNDDRSSVALTPRLTCYQSFGSLGGECSIGASLELASTDDDKGREYAVELNGERGQSFTSGAISASVSWPVASGQLDASAGVTQDGAMSISGLLGIKF